MEFHSIATFEKFVQFAAEKLLFYGLIILSQEVY